jgi:hypothetical protein
MQSSRVRLMLVALLGVFAFCAVAAAAAEAEEAPFWTVPRAEGSTKGNTETKRLAVGSSGPETRFITAKSYKTTKLSVPSLGITVTCPALKLKSGVLLGSNAGEPGTNDEIIEFEKNGTEKCTQTGNGTEPGCKVVEPITTTNVRSELAEDTTKKKLLVEFKPEGARFTTIHYEGTCPVAKETAVEGSIAAEVLTDPNNGTLGEAVELPNTHKVATSWLLNFPATPIKKIWLVKAGSGSEVSVGLLSATEEAKFEGTALVLLANSKGVTVEENWSPLP